MTPTDIARDSERPRRLPLLIGSAVATACLGAGVASAQTLEPTDPEAAPEAVAGDVAVETEETGTDTTTPEDATAGETEATAGEAETTDRAAKGNRLTLRKEKATPNKVFWAGQRRAKFVYEFTGAQVADLNIEVWKKKDGDDEMIKRYRERNVEGGKTHKLAWNGRRSDGSQVRRATMYFVVDEAQGRRLKRGSASGDRYFKVYPAKFPVEGPHQYWDGFGAGRGHQGQDVGADCGTPLVAAEPGDVAYKGYDGGGYGYYVVINVRGSNRSEVYGHLRRSARVKSGSKVKTGERIGQVGETGNASGCHLHFEYRPNDNPSAKVTKQLKRWDSWS